jgi:hypothetical protein
MDHSLVGHNEITADSKMREEIDRANEIGEDSKEEAKAEEKSMNDEPLEPLPLGAENWLYSEWDFARFAYKHSPQWWFNICQFIVLMALNVTKLVSAVESRYYFFN